jgi:hypothetical protein
MTEPDMEAILAEIDALAGVPEMQPGDVTVQMLRELWSLQHAAVTDRMEKLVLRGLYESRLAMNPQTRRIIRVWRKR